MLNIFDNFGNVRADLAAMTDEIEALPDNQRTALVECVTACVEAGEADARVMAARKSVTAKIHEHDAAVDADQKANPAETHQSALAAVIAAGKPGYEPKVVKVNKKARAALAAAVASLAEARGELTVAEREFKRLDAIKGDKVLAWMASWPKITAESVHRGMVAAENDRKLKIAKGELPKPVVKEPPHQWPLEVVMKARGKVQNRLPVYHGSR
jgi:hypothetical protein